jgi:acyl carrier protein
MSVDSAASVRASILSEIQQIASGQKLKLATLSDELPLSESGLDSLSFAVLVARLEEKLGYDPFSAAEDVQFPVTFGDFVRIYENFAKST